MGYVSQDGSTITTWHGEPIGRVLSGTQVRLPQWSWVHGTHLTHFRVRLHDGRLAYGRSSRGILIRLRPYRTGA